MKTEEPTISVQTLIEEQPDYIDKWMEDNKGFVDSHNTKEICEKLLKDFVCEKMGVMLSELGINPSGLLDIISEAKKEVELLN